MVRAVQNTASSRTLAGSFFDAHNEIRSEVLDKTIAGPQREGSHQPFEVERLGRAQHRLGVLHELTDPPAQFERARCRNETASGPDQQRIAGRRTQSRQRPAHRRRTEPQPLGCARDAAFREQHIKGDQQVEIGLRHASALAQFDS